MPGLDLAVVDALGLKNVRQRICVDNTGCYGSFSALTVAQAFCAAEPDAVVLVTCTEVCSVHINKHSSNRSEILGNIIFGDGATSAILSAGKTGDWQVFLLSFILTCNLYGINSTGWDIILIGVVHKSIIVNDISWA